MSAAVVVAKLTAAEGQEDRVYEALVDLVGKTHEEEGCERYGLHRDVGNPRTFMFVEKWESMDHLIAHGGNPNLAIFGTLTEEGALEGGIDMTILEPVEAGDPSKAL